MSRRSRKSQPFQDAWGRRLSVGDFVLFFEQGHSPKPGLVRVVGNRSSSDDFYDDDPQATILLAWEVDGFNRSIAQHGSWSMLDYRFVEGSPHGATFPLFVRTCAEHNVIRVTRDSLPPDAVRCLEENADVILRRIR